MPSIKSFSVLLLLIATSKCIVSTIPTVKRPYSNQVHAISTEAVSCEEALILCKQSGMDLNSTKTPEEHDDDAIGQTLSSNFTKLVSSDFKYVAIKARVEWEEAFVLCKQRGMDLVSINSAEEEAALSEALSSHRMKGEHRYWISARRFSKNSFVWFASGQPIVYDNFADGQPDNAGNHEDCVEYLFQSEGIYKWNDIPCDQKRSYICQVRNVLY